MRIYTGVIVLWGLYISACTSKPSIDNPTKANVLSIKQAIGEQGKKISLGHFHTAKGVSADPKCRLTETVTVDKGTPLPKYIREAFIAALSQANSYDHFSNDKVNGKITELTFSSVAPASWKISLDLSSQTLSSYSVSVEHKFKTSFAAHDACEHVIQAFPDAVQALIKEVVTHPDFSTLAK
ncbi:hypothetical protein [Parashewanella tropica]|uniref:hypothetical protein n=1 Tax=Parashewanella tropica TaxID=2547970 RepID=UPI00105977FB|nr:hypothetical protein [Parashewanella tropica]